MKTPTTKRAPALNQAAISKALRSIVVRCAPARFGGMRMFRTYSELGHAKKSLEFNHHPLTNDSVSPRSEQGARSTRSPPRLRHPRAVCC